MPKVVFLYDPLIGLYPNEHLSGWVVHFLCVGHANPYASEAHSIG